MFTVFHAVEAGEAWAQSTLIFDAGKGRMEEWRDGGWGEMVGMEGGCYATLIRHKSENWIKESSQPEKVRARKVSV